MTDYRTSWAPEDEEQAMYLIDTTHEEEEFWEVGRTLAQWVMEYAPQEAETVVDYGCGIGRVIGQVDAKYPIGVDVSPQMIEMALDKYPHVQFVLSDGVSVPLPSCTVDYVYSILVLQHMDAEDVIAVLKDIQKVLVPGGKALLSFSAFGADWDERATLRRGPLNWAGKRLGSSSPAHGAIAYTEEIVRSITERAKLKVDSIFHEVQDDYHHNYVLIASK